MREEVTALLAANAEHARRFRSRFDAVQDGQHPTAVTVACADSRVLQDHLWGNDEPGRLFTCSNIGNRVVQGPADDPTVSGDVLYPLVHADTDLVIVVGHTGCGAVTAAYDALVGRDGARPPGIARCLALLTDTLGSGVDALPDDLPRGEAVNRLVEYHVDRQVECLVASDAVPAGVDVVGTVYDFQDVYPGDRGLVHVINVAGERSVDALRHDHPEVADRIHRRWAY